jgi:Transposase DDE domain group 1
LVLLRQVDRRIGLSQSLAKRLPDRRDPDKIEHSLESMLRQRIYGLALGYEDLNDHETLRKDLLWQTASERTEELASCSTLCRLENRAGGKEAWLMHQVLFEQFVDSFESAPSELILDFDCTDDRVHGLHRFGQTCVGDLSFVGQGAAPTLAQGQNHPAGRQRFLPVEDARLV